MLPRFSGAATWRCRGGWRRPCAAMLVLALLSVGVAEVAAAARLERLEAGRADLALFVLNGRIDGGETLALEIEISKLPEGMPVAVILNSPGGHLGEGIKLGEFFYKAKIPTFVMGFGGVCTSACSLAFLGGRDRVSGAPTRIKMTGGQLGFHQFHFGRPEEKKDRVYKKADVDEVIERTRRVAHMIIRYLKSIGEHTAILHLMLKAPSESMNMVTNEEALLLGIHVMGDEAAEFIDSAPLHKRVQHP